MIANQILWTFVWVTLCLFMYSLATEDRAWIFATTIALVVLIITYIIVNGNGGI